MRKILSIAASAVLMASFGLGQAKKPDPAQDEKIVAGKTAAISWLASLDKEDYATSWDEAASIFKDRVAKEQWVKGVGGVRQPLGKMLSRKFIDARYARTLPGAPDGEYVVVHYDTSFEHKQSATETVVPTLDKDGHWRVSGYFVK
jgi:hypothetical protein